jgi:hypothetical protein
LCNLLWTHYKSLSYTVYIKVQQKLPEAAWL